MLDRNKQWLKPSPADRRPCISSDMRAFYAALSTDGSNVEYRGRIDGIPRTVMVSVWFVDHSGGRVRPAVRRAALKAMQAELDADPLRHYRTSALTVIIPTGAAPNIDGAPPVHITADVIIDAADNVPDLDSGRYDFTIRVDGVTAPPLQLAAPL